jgi:hypothetical protein
MSDLSSQPTATSPADGATLGITLQFPLSPLLLLRLVLAASVPCSPTAIQRFLESIDSSLSIHQQKIS